MLQASVHIIHKLHHAYFAIQNLLFGVKEEFHLLFFIIFVTFDIDDQNIHKVFLISPLFSPQVEGFLVLTFEWRGFDLKFLF
jgi:hypothetical protein